MTKQEVIMLTNDIKDFKTIKVYSVSYLHSLQKLCDQKWSKVIWKSELPTTNVTKLGG